MRLLGIGSFRGVIMAKIKLTKSAVDAAQPQAQAVELRDTLVPGFLCKITPSGRKVFMLQYRTNAGERRKPALGQRSEEHTSELQSLMRISYAVFCLKKKQYTKNTPPSNTRTHNM